MRPNLIGVGIGLVTALVGGLLGNIPLVLLGIVVAFAVVAIGSLRATRAAHVDDSYEDLSPESRILIRPLKKIYNEMSDAAASKSETISPYLAQEALAESGQLLKQSMAALSLRDRLMRESRSRYDAEKSVDDLQSRLSTAQSEDEKTSLKSALDARTQEIGHYDQLKKGIAKIETSVKQAEAAMAEMRARLVSSGSADVAAQGSDPLREAVGRMQALSASLTEAQEMLQK